MKIRRLWGVVLACCVMLSLGTTVYAAEEQPQYAITDDAVIIDYVEYKIVNNTIQYDGEIYEIDGYTLVTYDDEGPIYLVLPVEQNRVTDPDEIAELNASIGKGDPSSKAVPTNPLGLPYAASVAEGDYLTVTPTFNIINGSFQYSTNLRISDLPGDPLFTNPEHSTGIFYVIFSMCDETGRWYENAETTQNFLRDPTAKFQNLSSTRYGRFAITNLYGDPSPAYDYSVYLATP